MADILLLKHEFRTDIFGAIIWQKLYSALFCEDSTHK